MQERFLSTIRLLKDTDNGRTKWFTIQDNGFYGFQGNRKRSFNGYGLSGFLQDLDIVVFQDWVGLFGGFGYFVLADTKMQ